MVGSSLWYDTTLTSDGDSGDIMFLTCHVAAYLKGYVNLWVQVPHGRSPSYHVWRPLV